MEKAAVLGAGSFGTALGFVLAEKGYRTALWTRNASAEEEINFRSRNERYLPGFALPENLKASQDLKEVLEDARMVLFVLPTRELSCVASECREFLPPDVPLIVASKGIERKTLRLPPRIMEDALPAALHENLAYLSGPSFAGEIIQRLPTVVCIASRNEKTARRAQHGIAHDYFRVYWSPDTTGVELGGALKNVIAIAAGVSDGLGMGHNTRAAIITRGLREITRLGKAMGADPMTFMGLSGLGDLVLTCTADLSRNRTLGFELGRGRGLEEILAGRRQTVEGVETAESAHALSGKLGVEMAITREVYRLLYEGSAPGDAVRSLMERELKQETT